MIDGGDGYAASRGSAQAGRLRMDLKTVEAPMDVTFVRRSCRVGLIVLAGMLVSVPALAQTRVERFDPDGYYVTISAL